MFVFRLIGVVVVAVCAGSGVQRISGPKLTNVTGRSDTAQQILPRLASISGQPGASQLCDECETATVEALQEPQAICYQESQAICADSGGFEGLSTADRPQLQVVASCAG
jgi:hypothetical protein